MVKELKLKKGSKIMMVKSKHKIRGMSTPPVKEFNLSKEIITLKEDNRLSDEIKGSSIIKTIRVKEFIKRLKDLSAYMVEGAYCLLCKKEAPTNHEGLCIDCIIDKLAGDKFNDNTRK